jgi:ABC-type phosphate transport system substrate-binding protein
VTRPTFIALLLAIALIGAVRLDAPRAGTATFKVIVHPDNPADRVDRGFVRRAFLKKDLRWKHGASLRPIDLPRGTDARERFTRDVLKKSPAQLRNYWNQQVFSGKGVPPPEADSEDAAIAYVLANPGALGYLPSDADPQGAKVIQLD